mmetsp:Transcript_24115/g.35738  ORF Transcript_24115/g.35738 Transcript_24115/m.35738 type:complete len:341 (-) Transcript_24115:233-1255(-)
MKPSICCWALLSVVKAIPFQMTVDHRATECFYEKMNLGDSGTLSVLITDGDSLRANFMLEGPFARSDVDTTQNIVRAEYDFVKKGNRWTEHTMDRGIIDFEHLQIPEWADIEERFNREIEQQHYDDDDSIWNGLSEEETKKLMEDKRRQNIERHRRIETARRDKEKLLEERAKHLSKKVKAEGEPREKTIYAKADGWYRACVMASFNKITVEFEFRNGRELGGIDTETGHVFTCEKYEELKEQRLLDEDTAEDEPSIKAEDFQGVRDQIRELRRILNQISTMQNTARNRMKQHGKVSEHSQSKMRMDSLAVTVLFIVVSVYQAYTIQRWFSKGNMSLLGR